MTDEAEFDEESLVFVELNGIIDGDWLSKEDIKCKIVGLESETPVLQLDRYVFIGEYQDAPGTDVFFEKNAESEDADANRSSEDDDRDQDKSSDKPKYNLKYSCNTHKKLCMKRAFLTEKEERKEVPETGKPKEDSNSDKVAPSSGSGEGSTSQQVPQVTSTSQDAKSETGSMETTDSPAVAPPAGQTASSPSEPCSVTNDTLPESVQTMDISQDKVSPP